MSLTKPPKRRGFFGPNDRSRELAEGSLPCRSCGVGVVLSDQSPIEMLTIHGPITASGRSYDTDIRVTTCNACADRRDRAALIMRNHPAVDREHGNVGIDRLDAALSVLDVLGRTPRIAETLAATDTGLRELIATFAALGGWCSWSASSARPGICASRRWGHVSDGLWEDAGHAFADLFRRRLEVPKPLAPPTNRGALPACGFCGVGSIIGKESDTLAIWGEPYRMPLTALGGWGGETVIAHVCPQCRRALHSSGNAIGLPAVWLAAIRSRGYEPRSSAGVVSLTGVRPWAVLPRSFKPNSTPWAHIDLTALDNELAFTIHVRRDEVAR